MMAGKKNTGAAQPPLRIRSACAWQAALRSSTRKTPRGPEQDSRTGARGQAAPKPPASQPDDENRAGDAHVPGCPRARRQPVDTTEGGHPRPARNYHDHLPPARYHPLPPFLPGYGQVPSRSQGKILLFEKEKASGEQRIYTARGGAGWECVPPRDPLPSVGSSSSGPPPRPGRLQPRASSSLTGTVHSRPPPSSRRPNPRFDSPAMAIHLVVDAEVCVSRSVSAEARWRRRGSRTWASSPWTSTSRPTASSR